MRIGDGRMKTDRRPLRVAVVAALAATMLATVSSASAAVWKHEGVNVTGPVKFTVTGGELIETPSGGMVCEVHATVATKGGSIGEVTSFASPECPTVFGNLAGCSVTASQALGLPWQIHVNASDLTITKWRVRRTFDAGCAVSELDKTIPSVTAMPDVPSAISELEISGETTGYSMLGSLSVAAPNTGTYGIG